VRRLLGGLIALLLLLLAACDGQLPGLGGPEATPTGAATAAAVTSPAGEASPVAATPTLAVATPTTTPTPWPTATPGPSPTPEPAALLAAAGPPRLKAVLPSPDELLRAEVLVYDCAPINDAALGSEPQPISLEILRVVDAAGWARLGWSRWPGAWTAAPSGIRRRARAGRTGRAGRGRGR